MTRAITSIGDVERLSPATVSYLVPTVGRALLINTLNSIECWPGDEILVICAPEVKIPEDDRVRRIDCPPGGDWGHSERNFAMPLARGSYLAHIDDDDMYATGTRTLMDDAIFNTPNRPIIFRMQAPNGITLWRDQWIYCGNQGTPCYLHPNKPEMFGFWGPFVGGDCHFLETSKWAGEDYVWRPEIIAHLGHNFGEVLK